MQYKKLNQHKTIILFYSKTTSKLLVSSYCIRMFWFYNISSSGVLCTFTYLLKLILNNLISLIQKLQLARSRCLAVQEQSLGLYQSNYSSNKHQKRHESLFTNVYQVKVNNKSFHVSCRQQLHSLEYSLDIFYQLEVSPKD